MQTICLYDFRIKKLWGVGGRGGGFQRSGRLDRIGEIEEEWKGRGKKVSDGLINTLRTVLLKRHFYIAPHASSPWLLYIT